MSDEFTLKLSFLAGALVVFLFVNRYFRGDQMVWPFFPSFFTLALNNLTRFKLDAIPTIGFSHPILSYLSAVKFNFDDVHMLKDGYEKVICPFPISFLISN
jgi:hypothetical protein